MKKYFYVMAALLIGATALTSCGDDDASQQESTNKTQITEAPVVKETSKDSRYTVMNGDSLVIAPKYDNVDEKTTYEWRVNGKAVSFAPSFVYTFPTTGSYIVEAIVTNSVGTTKTEFHITVADRKLTFEGDYWTKLIDSPQYGGELLTGNGKDVLSYSWFDETTKIYSELSATWGGTYGYSEGGIAISNYIDADIKGHATYEYQLAVPQSNGSQNFAVAFMPATICFKDTVARVIESMEVSPTTYGLGVITYGNGAAVSLAEEGYLTVKATGYNNGEETGYITFDLARDGKLVTGWADVDFTELGAVTSITFTMTGSDTGGWGLNSPAYFAFDNVVVKF